MRTLAVGDIHGCLTALETVLAAASLADDDRLVTLGDYVDRGPDSRGVIDWLIERKSTVGNLIALRGNHDVMMVTARDGGLDEGWLSVGGCETLASYGQPINVDHVPDSHWRFLEEDCQDYFEADEQFFVHGNVDPDLPLAEQPTSILYWEKCHQTRPHQSGKTMICGHTAQKNGLPLDMGHAICIDTWVYGRIGWLTCLDVDSGRYWQANERGETRTGSLLRDFAE